MVGQVLSDKYRIDGIISEDEFGTVYSGTHLLMEMPVSIKILAPALSVDQKIVEKFSFEAKTISRLSHPNILNVTDFGTDLNDSVFIVMEYVEGKTAKELVSDSGPLSVERAVRVTRQVAGALSAAHSNGIVHTALSSERILVSSVASGQDIVKLIDLGSFSTAARSAPSTDSPIEQVAYLSPEQCSLESEPDERSDIYSLGIVFYELLTGELPFMADTAPELMLKHAEVPPPPLAAFRSDIPDEIEPILLNALAKNPDKRYQSAAAFADDLAEAVRGEDEDNTIVIPKVKPDSSMGNNTWKTAFIVLAGMSLLAFGMMYWTQTRRVNPITQLPVDAESRPVQPLNPATGVNEQGNLMTLPPGTLVQGDSTIPDVGGGGGDGYDPWANVSPPRGGGSTMDLPVGPGGEVYTIPGGDGSVFMPNPDGSGVILVPKYVPEESPTPEAKSSPGAEKSPETASPSPTPSKTTKPVANPTPKATTPKPEKPKETPAKKPDPKTEKPTSKNQSIKSGVEADT